MKYLKNYLLTLVLITMTSAQDDYYPAQNTYGGGVGFSQMFLLIDIGELPAFEMLGKIVDETDPGKFVGLGLPTSEFSSPFVISGGEGFSQITGKWRLGGYAGVGSSQISGKASIFLFTDQDTNGVYVDTTDGDLFEYTGSNAPDIRAKFSMWIGGAMVEYVFPLFKGLEISPGALIGFGRANLNISHGLGSTGWSDQFKYQLDSLDNNLFPVGELDGDTSEISMGDITYFQNNGSFSVTPTTGSMTSLSGTFISLQPYIALKLQVLDRVGIRLTAGFNLGEIKQGKWVLNNLNALTDSPLTSFNGVTIRAMLYFGL